MRVCLRLLLSPRAIPLGSLVAIIQDPRGCGKRGDGVEHGEDDGGRSYRLGGKELELVDDLICRVAARGLEDASRRVRHTRVEGVGAAG